MSWHSRIRLWVGRRLDSHAHRTWAYWFEVPFVRCVVAVHCVWLALTGDDALFDLYTAPDHPGLMDRRARRRLLALESAYDRDPDGPARVVAVQRLQQIRALRREADALRDLLRKVEGGRG